MKANEVWGMFISDTAANKLEVWNNRVAKSILCVPRGSPNLQILTEAGIDIHKNCGEDQAAKLLANSKKLECRIPLNNLAHRDSRPRLTSIWESGFRTDWRKRVNQRLIFQHQEIREDAYRQCKQVKEQRSDPSLTTRQQAPFSAPNDVKVWQGRVSYMSALR